MLRKVRSRNGLGMTVAVAFMAVQAGALAAQDVEEELRTLSQENAQLYLRPATAGLIASMNSGLFHTARVHRPWGFDLGIRASGSFVTDDDLLFAPIVPTEVEFDGVAYTNPWTLVDFNGTPTPHSASVAGESGNRLVPTGAYRDALTAAGEDPARHELQLPDGVNVPVVPFAAAQVTLGLPYGTDVGVRFLPTIELGDEFGSLGSMGFTVKHSVSQHLWDEPPVDLSVLGNFQRLEVGDYLTARSRAFGLLAGRKFLILSLYGGATLESGSVDVRYDVENLTNHAALDADGTRIEFTDTFGTSPRFTGGATLHLAGLLLNADYSAGERQTVSAKFLISVR